MSAEIRCGLSIQAYGITESFGKVMEAHIDQDMRVDRSRNSERLCLSLWKLFPQHSTVNQCCSVEDFDAFLLQVLEQAMHFLLA